MKTIALSVLVIAGIFCPVTSRAQPDLCTNCFQLDAWYFPDTNWLSDAGYLPLRFTNIVNVSSAEDGNQLLIDTTNATSAFVLYNIVQTNLDSTTFTNITPAAGTIYLWFRPNWTSTNQGGTGPGNWANLLSIGQTGTNGTPWWGWYLSPDGGTIYFGSQTNGGSASVYLSAPVSFLTTNWYNLTLVYGPTNCAFFTNGVLVTNGTGVTNLPGPSVTFFAIGSDTNGYYQARGQFSDLETYNYQFDSNAVWENFSFLTISYGLAGSEAETRGMFLTNAPPAPPLDPAPHWFSGLGDLQPGTYFTGCPTGSNFTVVWLTNFSVALQTNGTATVTFTIEGGSTNSYYDVFGCTSLAYPATNTVWSWLGQGPTCTQYTLTNLPDSGVFLMLGTPLYPTNDDVGLTIAFETLVSHTSTNSTTYDGLPNAWIALNGLQGTNNLPNLDPDQDGLNNMQEYLYGSKPLVPEGITPWVANPSGYSGIP